MKITSEIFQVGGERYTHGQDAAVYLVVADNSAVLVDSGCGHAGDRLIENIHECGVSLEKIELLLLTHCHFDHTGGGKHLRDSLGCKTVAHELDAPYIETGDNTVSAASWYNSELDSFPIDIKLGKPTETIQLDNRTIEAIHIPGHSPGSLAFVFESDGKKVLFGQDVHGPLHPDLKSVRSDYEKSLRTLIDLKADILCEGHYGVISGRDEVTCFIRSFL